MGRTATGHGNGRRQRRRISRAQVSAALGVLYSIFRFVGRHIRGFWGALGAVLTLSLAIGLAATAVFAAIAEAVDEGLTQPFDEAILRWVAGFRTPTLDGIMLEITALGSGSVLILMVLTVSVFLWLTRHKWSVYLLYLGVAGGLIANAVLKQIFSRPRPSVVELGEVVHTLSFPSGHAMTSIITYGCIAYLVGRLGGTKRLRYATWIAAAILILLIGISRIYLGVHYPSDVLAGFLGGAAWLGLVASGLAAVEFFADRRPETTAEEKDLHAEAERAAGDRA
jgi:undecaprenyl-diphosphatase